MDQSDASTNARHAARAGPLPDDENPKLARLAKELNLPPRKLRLLIRLGRTAGELAGFDEPHGANEPPDPEPWPEPVRAGELLGRITHAIAFHVAMDRRLALVAALWAMHTHIAGQFSRTPRLVIHSGRVASGKTTLLSVLSSLVLRPLTICVATPKSLLHSLRRRPTLLLDDASALLQGNREMRALIRNGCCRAGPRLLRMNSGLAEQIDLFTPIALALDGDIPPMLAGRALGIPLEPLKYGETAGPLDAAATGNLLEMRRMIARWAQDRDDVPADAAAPECRDPNWRPVLAIAAEIGPEWRGRAGDAMKLIRGVSATSELERLLTDVHTVVDEIRVGNRWVRGRDGKLIADHDRIRSIDLTEQLCVLQSCRWREHGKIGQPITPNALARILAGADIRPAMFRFHTGDEPGYLIQRSRISLLPIRAGLRALPAIQPAGGSGVMFTGGYTVVQLCS